MSDAEASMHQGGLILAGGGQSRGTQRTTVFRSARARTTMASRLGLASALEQLEREVGPLWSSWDPDTGVPSRVVFSGLTAPNTVADASAAASFAERFLERHLGVLAPGTHVHDWTLVTNDLSGDIRTVAFTQSCDDLPVLDGQLSFRFKHDRLVALASEALPHPVATPPKRVAPTTELERGARDWLNAELGGSTPRLEHIEGPFVLPIVGRGKLEYRTVMRTVAHHRGPHEQWAVYLDPETGTPIARRAASFQATGQLQFNVPVRQPTGRRFDASAAAVEIAVDGESVVTDAGGQFEFATEPATATVVPRGPDVEVIDEADSLAEITFDDVRDGDTLVWDVSFDEGVDAQLTAFVHAGLAKDYVRQVAPDLAWLAETLPVSVNIDEECNAFSDGSSINFFSAGFHCENTARLPDVIYHEFAHTVHVQSLLLGAGTFDVALSEGLADYLSATMTGDHRIAPGFFFDERPLRELDPDGFEWVWPRDRGEVHNEGRIIGGALWDLRKLLIAKHGEATGIALTDEIWYESARRAANIPAMYVEALVVDDDDGDLTNGTPNGCEINAAFGPHGLFSLEADATVLHTATPEAININLAVDLPSFDGCPVRSSAQLEVRTRGSVNVQSLPMSQGPSFAGTIPRQRDGRALDYAVVIDDSTGTTRRYPNNLADPWYQAFDGPVTPLYCFGDDQLAGWTNIAGFGVGLGSGDHDPIVPFDGDELSLAMLNDYGPNNAASIIGPAIDVQGFEHVRLQYWRWLTVEDGFYDSASIASNEFPVWENFAGRNQQFAHTHHVDREWRFHDVDLSHTVIDGEVQLRFDLVSDQGLHFGGWNIDGLCVVGVEGPAPRTGRDAADDDATQDSSATAGCGCTSSPRHQPLWLLALLLGVGLRRRRP